MKKAQIRSLLWRAKNHLILNAPFVEDTGLSLGKAGIGLLFLNLYKHYGDRGDWQFGSRTISNLLKDYMSDSHNAIDSPNLGLTIMYLKEASLLDEPLDDLLLKIDIAVISRLETNLMNDKQLMSIEYLIWRWQNSRNTFEKSSDKIISLINNSLKIFSAENRSHVLYPNDILIKLLRIVNSNPILKQKIQVSTLLNYENLLDQYNYKITSHGKKNDNSVDTTIKFFLSNIMLFPMKSVLRIANATPIEEQDLTNFFRTNYTDCSVSKGIGLLILYLMVIDSRDIALVTFFSKFIW